MLELAIAISLGLLAFLLAFGVGFAIGYGIRKIHIEFRELEKKFVEFKLAEAPESAVVDDSPRHLKEKREERVRKGEEPDDDESQIVTTKTTAQRRAASQAVREAKLDKWMPGVKHGE